MSEIILTMNYNSPWGELILGSFNNRICLCDWTDSHRRISNDSRIRRYLKAECATGLSQTLETAATQLDQYFAGQIHDFDLPVIFAGSEFQCSVWSELMRIPYGTTVSYAELARRINNPRAVRAVAAAVAGNPISIIVPCHRVIGSDNTLIGYAGGLTAKQGLLSLETRENRE